MHTLKKLSRNKVFYIILLIIAIFLPAALYAKAQTEDHAIATIFGIDKEEDQVVATVLITAISSAGQNANVTKVDGKGENLAMAVKSLELSLGKKLGLAHSDAIVLGDKVVDEDITQYLDYFMRVSNLPGDAVLVYTDGKASDFLEAISKEEGVLNLSIKNLYEFNEHNQIATNMHIKNYYDKYFTGDGSAILPLMSTTEDSEQQSQSQNQSGDNSSSGTQGSSQGGSSKKLENEGKAAIFKKGKLIRVLTEDEVEAMSYLSKDTKLGYLKVDDIYADGLTGADLTYEIIKKQTKLNYTFKNGKPILKVDVKMLLRLDEVDENGYKVQDLDSTKTYLNDEVRKKIENNVKEGIVDLYNNLILYNTDILSIDLMFNRFHHNKWQKFKQSLENEGNYLDNVGLDFNFQIRAKF